jgi:glycosyltransferase involved in cell wall biosynthesis
MILSILIPSLSRRHAFLTRLLEVLYPQVIRGIEILINVDSGHKSIGQKRNDLLAAATGDYVVFVDDDDMVSFDYVLELQRGILKRVDAVSVRGQHLRNGEYWRQFIDKPGQPFACVEQDGVTTVTYGIQHLDCIKRSIAQQFKFEDIRFGEDRRWALAVEQSGLVKTSYQVPKDVYYYEIRDPKAI